MLTSRHSTLTQRVVRVDRRIAQGRPGGVQVHVGHARQPGMRFQQGLTFEATFPELALAPVLTVGPPSYTQCKECP